MTEVTPHTTETSPLSKKYTPLVLHPEYILRLENIIPLMDLYRATLALQKKLEVRAKAGGYQYTMDDVEAPKYPDEFAHLLEHAILSVIDNNLSTVATVSVGSTEAYRIVDRKQPIYNPKKPFSRISHGHIINLNPAPTIPPQFYGRYVKEIIEAIVAQVQRKEAIDLEAIKLEKNK